jgi:hypothetical protein
MVFRIHSVPCTLKLPLALQVIYRKNTTATYSTALIAEASVSTIGFTLVAAVTSKARRRHLQSVPPPPSTHRSRSPPTRRWRSPSQRAGRRCRPQHASRCHRPNTQVPSTQSTANGFLPKMRTPTCLSLDPNGCCPPSPCVGRRHSPMWKVQDSIFSFLPFAV